MASNGFAFICFEPDSGKGYEIRYFDSEGILHEKITWVSRNGFRAVRNIRILEILTMLV